MTIWEEKLEEYMQFLTARRLSYKTIRKERCWIARAFSLENVPTDPAMVGIKEFTVIMDGLNHSRTGVQGIGRFLRWCKNDIYYQINPQWPKVEREPRTIPLSLASAILQSFPKIKGWDAEKCRFVLEFCNLYRRIDVHNAKVDYINLENMTQTIHGKGRGGGKIVDLPLNHLGVEWIAVYLQKREMALELMQARSQEDTEYLYLHWRGNVIHPGLTNMDNSRLKFIEVLREQLGSPNLYFTDHDLRRTGATAMLEAGVDIAKISIALRHDGEAQTWRYLGLKARQAGVAFMEMERFMKDRITPTTELTTPGRE